MKIAVLNLPADQFILVFSEVDPIMGAAINEQSDGIRDATGARAVMALDRDVEVVEMGALEEVERIKAAVRDFLEQYEGDPTVLEAAVAEPSDEWTPEETERLRAMLAEPAPSAGEIGEVRIDCAAHWETERGDLKHRCVSAPGHEDAEHTCRCGEKAPRGSSKVTQHGR